MGPDSTDSMLALLADRIGVDAADLTAWLARRAAAPGAVDGERELLADLGWWLSATGYEGPPLQVLCWLASIELTGAHEDMLDAAALARDLFAWTREFVDTCPLDYGERMPWLWPPCEGVELPPEKGSALDLLAEGCAVPWHMIRGWLDAVASRPGFAHACEALEALGRWLGDREGRAFALEDIRAWHADMRDGRVPGVAPTKAGAFLHAACAWLALPVALGAIAADGPEPPEDGAARPLASLCAWTGLPPTIVDEWISLREPGARDEARSALAGYAAWATRWLDRPVFLSLPYWLLAMHWDGRADAPGRAAMACAFFLWLEQQGLYVTGLPASVIDIARPLPAAGGQAAPAGRSDAPAQVARLCAGLGLSMARIWDWLAQGSPMSVPLRFSQLAALARRAGPDPGAGILETAAELLRAQPASPLVPLDDWRRLLETFLGDLAGIDVPPDAWEDAAPRDSARAGEEDEVVVRSTLEGFFGGGETTAPDRDATAVPGMPGSAPDADGRPFRREDGPADGGTAPGAADDTLPGPEDVPAGSAPDDDEATGSQEPRGDIYGGVDDERLIADAQEAMERLEARAAFAAAEGPQEEPAACPEARDTLPPGEDGITSVRPAAAGRAPRPCEPADLRSPGDDEPPSSDSRDGGDGPFDWGVPGSFVNERGLRYLCALYGVGQADFRRWREDLARDGGGEARTSLLVLLGRFGRWAVKAMPGRRPDEDDVLQWLAGLGTVAMEPALLRRRALHFVRWCRAEGEGGDSEAALALYGGAPRRERGHGDGKSGTRPAGQAPAKVAAGETRGGIARAAATEPVPEASATDDALDGAGTPAEKTAAPAIPGGPDAVSIGRGALYLHFGLNDADAGAWWRAVNAGGGRVTPDLMDALGLFALWACAGVPRRELEPDDVDSWLSTPGARNVPGRARVRERLRHFVAWALAHAREPRLTDWSEALAAAALPADTDGLDDSFVERGGGDGPGGTAQATRAASELPTEPGKESAVAPSPVDLPAAGVMEPGPAGAADTAADSAQAKMEEPPARAGTAGGADIAVPAASHAGDGAKPADAVPSREPAKAPAKKNSGSAGRKTGSRKRKNPRQLLLPGMEKFLG